MIKKWVQKEAPSEEFKQNFSKIPPLVTTLLYNRGIKNQQEYEAFIKPDYATLYDPFLFDDMEKTVGRVLKAIARKEKIIVHGDYDADGVTSSALVYNALKLMGATVDAFIPHREDDGYGLNIKNIERFVEEKYQVLITVDCGITNVKEVTFARDNGMDVIITDHHNIPEIVPPAFAILNPKMPEESYPFKYLSGVGIAYKFISALLQRYEGDDVVFEEWGGREGYLKWILDIVAIGLVADIMPLIDENRTLVTYGLLVLKKTHRLGLRKLAQVAGIDMEQADSFTIGFQIAPRINAAGRLAHGKEAFQLLTTEDPDEATSLAMGLQDINKERRTLTDKALKQAREQALVQAKNDMIFVYAADWNPGIVGLIAGRICEEYYKPTMAMTRIHDTVVGSGRSVGEFNVTDSLYAAEDVLLRFGGHQQACGFTIKHYDQLSSFKELLLADAKKKMVDIDLTPFVEVDTMLTLSEATLATAKILEQFQPYGEKNPKPKFWLRKMMITALDYMGDGEKHLRIMVRHQNSPVVKKLVGFNIGQSWGKLLAVGDVIDVIVELGVNVWRGVESVQLQIIDLRKGTDDVY